MSKGYTTTPSPTWETRAAAIQTQPISVTIAGAMALTGLGEEFLRAAIKRGDLEARLQGRKYVILTSELAAFVEALPVAEATA